MTEYSFNLSFFCRRYGVKCGACCNPVLANELIMRAADTIFHLPCFRCVACGCQLQKGDQFVVKDDQLFCRIDYEKIFQFYPYFHNNLNAGYCNPHGDWYPRLSTYKQQ